MIRRSLLALACITLLAGCASQAPESNEALDTARSAINAADSSQAVAEYAPVELTKANDRLSTAEQALAAGDEARAQHLAHLAQRHAEIALASAGAAKAEAASQRIVKQREKLQLEQREEEVQQQRREIDLLREQLSELNPRETERGIVLTIGNVLFAFDSAALNTSAREPLDRLAAFLEEHPERRIRIEGHTDSVGSASYNQRLSEQRAQSVASAMIQRGIAAERMTVVGYGENRPTATNDTESGRQQNRRVEFVILER